MKDFIDQLYLGLQEELPGEKAQLKMAHKGRRISLGNTKEYKKAAVLALFYPKKEDWNIVFIERVSNVKDRHSGQISFPGGRYEEGDQNFMDTAKREAEEEVGVSSQSIEILGALSSLYIPVSNFMVHPYVGFVDYTPDFRGEQSEVKAVLETPFKTFLKKETLQQTNVQVAQTIVLEHVPYYNIKNKVIWGATAMMMSELIEVVEKVQV